MSEILVQRRVSSPRGIPAPGSLRRFAAAAGAVGTLCLRIVDEAESRALNHQYRGKNAATNVLSFPAVIPCARSARANAAAPISHRLQTLLEEGNPLGDLILCAPVIAQEAVEQNKPPRAHWAHMVVHGVLHLRGFDHENDVEAAVMENEERRTLAGLGFHDPYSDSPP